MIFLCLLALSLLVLRIVYSCYLTIFSFDALFILIFKSFISLVLLVFGLL